MLLLVLIAISILLFGIYVRLSQLAGRTVVPARIKAGLKSAAQTLLGLALLAVCVTLVKPAGMWAWEEVVTASTWVSDALEHHPIAEWVIGIAVGMAFAAGFIYVCVKSFLEGLRGYRRGRNPTR
jgi:hypothetical protein